MPKGFSDREKEIIRNKLMEAGKDQFIRLGLKKTTVQELSEAAGIAKGSFYLFFSSKELLFMEILKEIEKEVQQEILSELTEQQGEPKEQFKSVLLKQFEVINKYPFLKKTFEKDEMEYLYRKLPEEAIKESLDVDKEFSRQLLSRWEDKIGTKDYGFAAACIRGIFFIMFHREEIGPEYFPRLPEHFMSLIVDWIFKE